MRPSSRTASASSFSSPSRNSSANPLIEVSGVRSSCEASAMNRRITSSERLAAVADARADSAASSRSRAATSIWASMALSERPSLPTSVVPAQSGTRRDRSPPAMSFAVRAISPSGRRLLRTSQKQANPSTTSVPPPAAATIRTSWETVASTSPRLMAVIRVRPPRVGTATTRQLGPSAPRDSTVNGRPRMASTSAAVRRGRSGVFVSVDSLMIRTTSPPGLSTTPWNRPKKRCVRPSGRGSAGGGGSRGSAATRSCWSTRSTR